MATQQINGSAVTGSSTRNNRGVVRHGGTIGHTRLVSKPLGDTLESQTGSRVIDNATVDKLNTNGNFAKMLARKYIIRRVTTEIAGVTNRALLTGASDFPTSPRKGIMNFKEAFSTRLLATALRTNKWDEVDGVFDSGFPQIVTDTFSADHVAAASRTTPGELVYRYGAATPKLDDYKEKTG